MRAGWWLSPTTLEHKPGLGWKCQENKPEGRLLLVLFGEMGSRGGGNLVPPILSMGFQPIAPRPNFVTEEQASWCDPSTPPCQS